MRNQELISFLKIKAGSEKRMKGFVCVRLQYVRPTKASLEFLIVSNKFIMITSGEKVGIKKKLFYIIKIKNKIYIYI